MFEYLRKSKAQLTRGLRYSWLAYGDPLRVSRSMGLLKDAVTLMW